MPGTQATHLVRDSKALEAVEKFPRHVRVISGHRVVQLLAQEPYHGGREERGG